MKKISLAFLFLCLTAVAEVVYTPTKWTEWWINHSQSNQAALRNLGLTNAPGMMLYGNGTNAPVWGPQPLNTLNTNLANLTVTNLATFLDSATVASNLVLVLTTPTSGGIVFKGTYRWSHDFKATNTSGQNTFLGLDSGNLTMAGVGNDCSYNTGIGYHVLQNATTAVANTGVGADVLSSITSGYCNSAVGWGALSRTTTGWNNSAVGLDALSKTTFGNNNSVLGANGLYNNVNGFYNSAVGVSALFKNDGGYDNSGLGYTVLYNNVNGIDNSAVGISALYQNTASFNTAIGAHALKDKIAGDYNAALGESAGRTIQAGRFSTFLGRGAGYNALQRVSPTNSTAVGANSYTTADNQVVIGDSNVVQTILRPGVLISSFAGLPPNPTNALDVLGKAVITEGLGVGVPTPAAGIATVGPLTVANALTANTVDVTNLARFYGGGATASLTASNTVVFVDGKLNATVAGVPGLVLIGDPAATTGNTRGYNAVDQQLGRNVATMIASGASSTIGGGTNCTASGTSSTVGGGIACTASSDYSTVGGGAYDIASGICSTVGGGYIGTASGYCSTVGGGYYDTASGDYSTVAGGYYGVASLYGELAHAAGRFSVSGDAQWRHFELWNITTNAVSTNLFLDGASLRLTIPTNTTWTLTGRVAARTMGTGAVDTANYKFEAAFHRDNTAASTTMDYQLVTALYETDATWDLTITADVTNGAVNLIAVGNDEAGGVHWVASVDVTQCGGTR